MCKTSQQELQELATKHQEQITELAEEQTKILVSGCVERVCLLDGVYVFQIVKKLI